MPAIMVRVLICVLCCGVGGLTGGLLDGAEVSPGLILGGQSLRACKLASDEFTCRDRCPAKPEGLFPSGLGLAGGAIEEVDGVAGEPGDLVQPADRILVATGVAVARNHAVRRCAGIL